MWSSKIKLFGDDILPISGKSIQIKRGSLNHSDLTFWENNPRIYSIVHQSNTPLDQDEIQLELLSLDHVKKLISSIKYHGNIQNPIVVLDKSFKVIEGNSRLAACRYLAQKNPKEFSKLSCIVLPEDTKEDLIYSYLNQEHIEGKTKWSAYEQAGVIYRLIENGRKPSELKAEMNISTQMAQKLYDTYSLMVKHGEDKPSRYSYYDVYLSSKKAKAKRKIDPKLDERIINEIREGKITAQELRKILPVVCDHSKEFNKFVSGKSSLLGAYEALEDKGKTKSLVVQLQKIHEQVKGMKKSEFDGLDAKPQQEAKYRLNRTITLLQNLAKQVYGK